MKIIAQNPTKFKRPFKPPQKFPTMKVDGIYGDATAAWIGAFQNGVVDRVRQGLQLWNEPSVPALLRDKVRNPATFL